MKSSLLASNVCFNVLMSIIPKEYYHNNIKSLEKCDCNNKAELQRKKKFFFSLIVIHFKKLYGGTINY